SFHSSIFPRLWLCQLNHIIPMSLARASCPIFLQTSNGLTAINYPRNETPPKRLEYIGFFETSVFKDLALGLIAISTAEAKASLISSWGGRAKTSSSSNTSVYPPLKCQMV